MRGDVSVPTNPTATDNVACQLRINSPLILHPNAPVSFYFPSLHSSASPPSPPSPIHSPQEKKSLKKTICHILVPLFCFHPPPDSPYSPIRLIINSSGSIHLGPLSVTHLITLLQQSFAFVMGDNATEIDLDSVIDRLLEGAFLLLGSENIIYGSGVVDSPYLPHSWWYSVHVGWHTHCRCPRYAARPPVSCPRRPQKELGLLGGLLSLIRQPFVVDAPKLTLSSYIPIIKPSRLDNGMDAHIVSSSTGKSTWEACSAPRVRDQISLHQSSRNFH